MPRKEKVTEHTKIAPAKMPQPVMMTCGGDSGSTGYSNILSNDVMTIPTDMKSMNVALSVPMDATRGTFTKTAKEPFATSAIIVNTKPATVDTMVAEGQLKQVRQYNYDTISGTD